MSSKKSFEATFTVLNPEELQKFAQDLVKRKPKRPEQLSHPALVAVRTGDGIGFDSEDTVAITNSNNNVTLLVKANYKVPFKPYESLNLSEHAIFHVQDLIPGHTYLIDDGDGYAFSKYLGHHTILIKTADVTGVTSFEGEQIPPHYELSVPNQSK